MILKLLRDDTRGAVIVEFSVTIAVFLFLTWGLIQAGLLLWTKSGMQHGIEVATRCASVNYSAYQLNLSTSCFTDPVSHHPTPSEVLADTKDINKYIETYAAQHSYGLVTSFSRFNVTFTRPPGGSIVCPTDVGYQVTATYNYNVLSFIFSPTLTATSSFPISCS